MAEPDFLLAPITALAFIHIPYNSINRPGRKPKPALVASEGHFLRVFDLNGRSLGFVRGFRGQPVHGIDIRKGDKFLPGCSTDVLAWGGRSVGIIRHLGSFDSYVYPFSDEEDVGNCPGLSETIAPDWILHGRFHPTDRSEVAFVTAHNEVVIGRLDSTNILSLSEDLISPSRPILYSARLAWLTDECLLVVGGTVFGEIIVWKCHLGDVGDSPRAEVLHVLTGHEGSIFDVDISEAVTLVAGTMRFILSCSDDRTVRVWGFPDTRNPHSTPFSAGDASASADMSRARETGFGDNTVSNVASGPKPAVVAMAHTSRIWKVRFGTEIGRDPGTSTMSLFSFGEDAMTQKWHMIISPDQDKLRRKSDLSGVKIVNAQTYGHHSGKHIWSTSLMDNRPFGKENVVTGGADGRIVLIGHSLSGKSLSNSFEDCSALSTSVADVLTPAATTTLNPGKGSKTKDVFHRYAFLSRTFLLALTTTGKLLVYSFQKKHWSRIRVPAGVEEAIGCYSVVTSSKTGLAFIGASQGQLYLHANSENYSGFGQLTTLPGKIQGIYIMAEPRDRESLYHLEVLVTVQGSPTAALFSVAISAAETPQVSLMTTLELDPRFIVTAAMMMRNGLIILGSRSGFLAIFKVLFTGDRCCTQIGTESYYSVSADAVTSIVPLPGQHTATPASDSCPSSPSTFLITTRDGKYRIFSVSSLATATPGTVDKQLSLSLLKLHETSPPFGPMIEGAWFQPSTPTTTTSMITDSTSPPTAQTSDLILCGFKSKSFVVWNETQRRTLASIPCGGAHRSFDYYYHQQPDDDNTINDASNSDDKDDVGPRNFNPDDDEYEDLIADEPPYLDDDFEACDGEGEVYDSDGSTRYSEPDDDVDCEDIQNINTPEGFRFAFTKSSAVHVHSQKTSHHQVLKPGGHGREIRSVSCGGLKSGGSGGGDMVLVATGSEDTGIRIWKADDEDEGGNTIETRRSSIMRKKGVKMSCVAALEPHTTGLQHLSFLPLSQTHDAKMGKGGRLLFSSGGNEEFFVWRVGQIDTTTGAGAGVGADGAQGSQGMRMTTVVKEVVLEDRSEARDLRIVSFDVTPLPLRKQSSPGEAVAEEDEEDTPTLIALALSNSTLKTYFYHNGVFTPLAKAKYTGACVTQVRHLDVAVSASGDGGDGRRDVDVDMTLLSAATDGYFVIWGTRCTIPLLSEESSSSPLSLRPTTVTARSTSSDDSPSSSEEVKEKLKTPIQTMTFKFAKPIHQSAIKSLALSFLDPSPSSGKPSSKTAIVATGGDDNALAITILSLSPCLYRPQPPNPDPEAGRDEGGQTDSRTQVHHQKTILIPSAHAAAVTGILLSPPSLIETHPSPSSWSYSSTSSSKKMRLKVISTSPDQRLKVWEIGTEVDIQKKAEGGQKDKEGDGEDEVDAVKVNIKQNHAIDVADAGVLEWLRQPRLGAGGEDEGKGGKVVVAGVGMEVWEV